MSTKNGHPLTVIHPKDDKPEEKVDMDGIRRVALARAVRWSLFALRACLVLMFILVLYRVADLAGIVGARN